MSELFLVFFHYIGPGKKGTGDCCFNDGFISFREIMDLYTNTPGSVFSLSSVTAATLVVG